MPSWPSNNKSNTKKEGVGSFYSKRSLFFVVWIGDVVALASSSPNGPLEDEL